MKVYGYRASEKIIRKNQDINQKEKKKINMNDSGFTH